MLPLFNSISKSRLSMHLTNRKQLKMASEPTGVRFQSRIRRKKTSFWSLQDLLWLPAIVALHLCETWPFNKTMSLGFVILKVFEYLKLYNSHSIVPDFNSRVTSMLKQNYDLVKQILFRCIYKNIIKINAVCMLPIPTCVVCSNME